MGGQTALNCALDLERHGVLAKYNVEMIGATADAIDKAEDRSRFDKAMRSIGLACPRAGLAHSMEEAYEVLEKLVFHASFVRLLLWAVQVVVLLTTAKNLKKSVPVVWICRQPKSC